MFLVRAPPQRRRVREAMMIGIIELTRVTISDHVLLAQRPEPATERSGHTRDDARDKARRMYYVALC